MLRFVHAHAEPARVRGSAWPWYLRTFAAHFADADSYNAAKHGMALRGGSQRFELEIDGWRLLERDGIAISWLARWPRDDPQNPPRWTQVSRLLDQDATISLIYTATNLMRSIWLRGRAMHLGDASDQVFRPPPPDALYEARGLRHHVIADVYLPFPADGEQQQMLVKSANLQAPPADETSDRPDRPEAE